MKSKMPLKAIREVLTGRNKAVASDKNNNQKLARQHRNIRAAARRPLPIPSGQKK